MTNFNLLVSFISLTLIIGIIGYIGLSEIINDFPECRNKGNNIIYCSSFYTLIEIDKELVSEIAVSTGSKKENGGGE